MRYRTSVPETAFWEIMKLSSSRLTNLRPGYATGEDFGIEIESEWTQQKREAAGGMKGAYLGHPPNGTLQLSLQGVGRQLTP
jgi:hypothetical protein